MNIHVIVTDNDPAIIAAACAIPVNDGSISPPSRFNVDNTKCAWGIDNALYTDETQADFDSLLAQYLPANSGATQYAQQFVVTDPSHRNDWMAQVLPSPWVDPDE